MCRLLMKINSLLMWMCSLLMKVSQTQKVKIIRRSSMEATKVMMIRMQLKIRLFLIRVHSKRLTEELVSL
ncbi:MAG: hypothetical protein D6746_08120 [Bacteroidetes bacterium]|nr:MAG: hypothetical protein D6746_08120 [Bacteroidota bacterium]